MSGDSASLAAKIDASARGRAEAGDLSGAATIAIQQHGPGLIGWLRTLTASSDEAGDVFAVVCERLWKALPTFVWGGSLRTWMYVTARRIVIDRRRRGHRHPEDALSDHPALAAAVRSTTAAFRKTAAKDRLAEIRAALPEDDRTLLILRVDREMSWAEIAEVFGGPGADMQARRTAAARIRKQFERLKSRLRRAWDVRPQS